jgi:hypothetical protein
MRKLESLVIILLIITNFSCGNDVNEGLELSNLTDGEIISNQVISIDPDNPLLFSLVTKNNEVIQFYGEKDSEGVPTKCNLISVQESESADPVLINLDDLGRPIDVIGSDGSAISFNYDKPDDIFLNVTYPNNEYNLSFSLNDYTEKNGFSDKIIKNSRRLGKKIAFANNFTTEKEAANSCDKSNINVKLTKCGNPPLAVDEYWVSLKVRTEDTNVQVPYQGGTFWRGSVGNGIYCFRVREPETIDTKLVQKICTGFSNVASGVCIGINLINTTPGADIRLCTSIAAASNLAAIPTFIGCEVLIKALALPCLSLSSSAVEGSDSVLDVLCQSSILELKPNPIPTTYYFDTEVSKAGYERFRAPKTKSYPISGPFEDIEIELPAKPEINDFYTVPFDPDPDTDYVATAIIECLDTPTQATITVVGTDGYTDSLTLELPAGNSSISIVVPSADSGILDKITVEVGGLKSYRAVIF